MKFKFCVLEADGNRQEFCLGQRNSDITIGSGSSDYIEIHGSDISPMHARLAYTYSGVYLIVLGKQGCVLEGTTMGSGSAVLLQSPSHFSIGEKNFLYTEETSPSNRSLGRDIQIVRDTNSQDDNLGTQTNPITLGVDTPVRSEPSTKKRNCNKPAVECVPNPTPGPCTPQSLEKTVEPAWFRENLVSCAICLDVMKVASSAVPCMHKFCNECLLRWRRKNKTCPRCRQHVTAVCIDRDFDQICIEYATWNNIPMPVADAPTTPTENAVRPSIRRRRRLGAYIMER